MNAIYSKLIDREKALLGDVEIIADVAYWPVRITEIVESQLDPTQRQILRYIGAGYKDKAALQRRLKHVNDLDRHIQGLIDCGSISVEQVEGATRLSEASPSDSQTDKLVHRVSDAVSGSPLPIADIAHAKLLEQLDPLIPIVADKEADNLTSDTRFLECLLMLVLSGPNKARAVRVFYEIEDIVDLQEILFDLVLDDSPRLSATRLAGSLSAPSPSEYANTQEAGPDATRVEATPIAPVATFEEPATKLNRPVTPPSATSPSTLNNRPSVEILSGRADHERILETALREATNRIVIVTPFIRRRLTDYSFRRGLSGALRRGVSVFIIHGMPTHGDQFDDTPHENERIESLVSEMGADAGRLKFIRVTSSLEKTTGEHSKILLCDDLWAVVTSFNWLSYQETNETGVRIDDPESVAKLATVFEIHLKYEAVAIPNRVEVESSWPVTAREMSEWIYGEYNSQ